MVLVWAWITGAWLFMYVYVCDEHKICQKWNMIEKSRQKVAQYYHNVSKYILLTAYVGLGVGKGVVGASDGSSSARYALHSL